MWAVKAVSAPSCHPCGFFQLIQMSCQEPQAWPPASHRLEHEISALVSWGLALKTQLPCWKEAQASGAKPSLYQGKLSKGQNWALAVVVQWIECQPANQGVTGSIPSQDTCLGCKPDPQLWVCETQPHIDVSLPLFSLSLPLSLKIDKLKLFFFKGQNWVRTALIHFYYAA